MATSASGWMTLPLDQARDLFANSSTFQTLTNSDDAAEAKGFTYLDELPPPNDQDAGFTEGESVQIRPYMLFWDQSFAWEKLTPNEPATKVRDSGVIEGLCLLPVEDGDEENPREAWFKARNDFGLIVKEVFNLDPANGFMLIRGIRVTERPIRTHEHIATDQGDFISFHFELDWGID